MHFNSDRSHCMRFAYTHGTTRKFEVMARRFGTKHGLWLGGFDASTSDGENPPPLILFEDNSSAFYGDVSIQQVGGSGGSLTVTGDATVGSLDATTVTTESLFITKPDPNNASVEFEVSGSNPAGTDTGNKMLTIHTPTGTGTGAQIRIGSDNPKPTDLQMYAEQIRTFAPTILMGNASNLTAATVSGTLDVTGIVTSPELEVLNLQIRKSTGPLISEIHSNTNAYGYNYVFWNPAIDHASSNGVDSPQIGTADLMIGDSSRTFTDGGAHRWHSVQFNALAGYYFRNTASNGVAGVAQVRIFGNLTITGTGTVSTVNISSDVRLKKKITATSSKWNFVKALQIKDYTRIATDAEETGIIAQDLELLEPVMVVDYETGDEKTTETYKAIKINSIVFSLAKALQEAQTRIEALEAKMLI